jgi:hypothetical protein
MLQKNALASKLARRLLPPAIVAQKRKRSFRFGFA